MIGEAVFLTSLYRQSDIELLTEEDKKKNLKTEMAWARKEGLMK